MNFLKNTFRKINKIMRKHLKHFNLSSLVLLIILAIGLDTNASPVKNIIHNPVNDKLLANVASIDISPPNGMQVALGGYGERMSKPALGIHDRIWAKALVLNKGKKKYVIITMDVLALPPNLKPQLVNKLGQKGWTEENLVILASHSHTSYDMTALNDKNNLNSPQLGIFQPQLLDFILQSLSELVLKADQNLKPVHVGTSSIILDNLNRNRRGDKAIDKEMTLTRFDLDNGKPLAVLVNWTAHPTFMSGKDMYISAGWPGYLQRSLSQWIGDGVTVMYYNGAEGDQSPIGQNVKSHYEKAEIYGRTLAIKALELYKNTKTKSNIVFDYNYTTLQLPKRVVHPSFMETGGEEYNLTPEALEVILKVMSLNQVGIGALRIGDLMLVGAPGEMAAGLGFKVKNKLKAKGIKHATIGGLANVWISYIISKDQYNNGGGYESSVSFYGEELGDIIVKGMINTSLPITK